MSALQDRHDSLHVESIRNVDFAVPFCVIYVRRFMARQFMEWEGVHLQILIDRQGVIIFLQRSACQGCAKALQAVQIQGSSLLHKCKGTVTHPSDEPHGTHPIFPGRGTVHSHEQLPFSGRATLTSRKQRCACQCAYYRQAHKFRGVKECGVTSSALTKERVISLGVRLVCESSASLMACLRRVSASSYRLSLQQGPE